MLTVTPANRFTTQTAEKAACSVFAYIGFKWLSRCLNLQLHGANHQTFLRNETKKTRFFIPRKRPDGMFCR